MQDIRQNSHQHSRAQKCSQNAYALYIMQVWFEYKKKKIESQLSLPPIHNGRWSHEITQKEHILIFRNARLGVDVFNGWLDKKIDTDGQTKMD